MSHPTVSEQQQVVDDALRSISHIATLPEVTLRIIELVEDPTATAKDLRRLIENDPALCARLLKVVNSSFYGLPGQIDSIDRAVVLLGLNAIKNIAISASLTRLFTGGQLCPGFSARDLWIHSAATATAAKQIAVHLGMAMSDQAFLAGLIHDVGVIVELQLERSRLIDVIAKVDPDKKGVPRNPMRDAERELFGADHERFGEGLCNRWKFPKALARVCGHHHEPLELPEGERTLICITHVADHCAAAAQLGFRLDLLTTEVNPAILDELSLTPEVLAPIIEGLPRDVDEVLGVLGG